MAYTKTKFHKKVMDSANGMHRSFIFYMVYNDSEYYSYRIPEVINFLIEINNSLSKRGYNKEKRIETTNKLINDRLNYKSYYSKTTQLEEWQQSITKDTIFKKLLDSIVKWKDLTEKNYEEYVKEIINYLEYLDSIHYDWKVDDNIIFEKSPYTRMVRSYSLTIHDKEEYETFKKVYREMISVEDGEFDEMCDTIYEFYTTLETTINSLVRKDYDDVVETIESYLEQTNDMKEFKDIYIKANYNKLYEVKEFMDKKYYDKANKKLRKIIELENYKFHKYKFKLFRLLQVDLSNDLYQIPLSKAISDYEKYTKKYMTD